MTGVDSRLSPVITRSLSSYLLPCWFLYVTNSYYPLSYILIVESLPIDISNSIKLKCCLTVMSCILGHLLVRLCLNFRTKRFSPVGLIFRMMSTSSLSVDEFAARNRLRYWPMWLADKTVT